jgi:DNA modification methylase
LNIRNRVRELRTVKAAELTPNPRNWRTHPKAQQDALKGILAEVGYADALLARELEDGTLMLVDGHLRAETTPEQEVPVLVLDIDEAEADKLLLSLDPLAALAETNAQALDTLLREVDTGSEGLQQMYADMAEVADLYKDEPAEVVEDEVPEPPADPITKPGDLWLLGVHRLLCGDSTKAEDVESLLADEIVDATITDPPYGIKYQSNHRKKKFDQLENDDRILREWIAPSIRHSRGWIVFFCAWQRLDEWMQLGREIGDLTNLLIWNKAAAMGDLKGSFSPTFEVALAYNRGEKLLCEGRPSAVFDYRIDAGVTFEHPTTKPVSLLADILLATTRTSVFDPFLGSGTTLIAAEQLGRKCYGMEISPQYCDVIVKRWETLTGKQAELEKPNGKTRTTARADDTEDSQGQPRKAAAKQARAKARK